MTPSLQTQQLLLQRSRDDVGQMKGRRAVIVGNPKMPLVAPDSGQPAKALAPLPGAETEARAIAPLLRTEALVGEAATETAVRSRLSDARIIHLATHGLLDEHQALQSAIALTPEAAARPGIDSPDDGLLTASEIMDLRLSAELVVLSACDTGRGRLTGDGVIGLARSFMGAGVPSIVVSLWAIPDAPTARLMTEFYRQLDQGQSKAQALRQAMLATQKTHPHPRNWAAFTLIGEAG